MDDIIYKKDYTFQDVPFKEDTEKARARLKNERDPASVLQTGRLALKCSLSNRIPRTVDPKRKAVFDHLIELCDKIAAEHNGRISAYRNKQTGRAVIDLRLTCAIFDSPSELEKLQEILAHVDTVFILPDREHPAIKIEFQLAYFKRAPIDTIPRDTLFSIARTIAEEMDLSCSDAELMEDVLDVVHSLRQEEENV